MLTIYLPYEHIMEKINPKSKNLCFLNAFQTWNETLFATTLFEPNYNINRFYS